MVDALFAEEDRLRGLGQEPGVSGPSPGVNKMEFKAPVRPGDTVTYTLVVTGKRPSNSIPGWGLLFNTLEAVNQRGELVYHAELVGFSKLRDYKMPLSLRLLMALTRLPVLGKLLRPHRMISMRPRPRSRPAARSPHARLRAGRHRAAAAGRSPSAPRRAIGAASRWSTTPRPAC